MAQPTTQEIEGHQANKRVKEYLDGGSRIVLISRGFVGGLIIVIWIVLWWLGY